MNLSDMYPNRAEIKRSQLPEYLYHVTTNYAAVRRDGKLKAMSGLDNGGLGGTESVGVSLIPNKGDAIAIKDELELINAVNMASSDQEVLSILSGITDDERREYVLKNYHHYFSFRKDAHISALEALNLSRMSYLFNDKPFSGIVVYFAKNIKNKDIGIVRVRTDDIPNDIRMIQGVDKDMGEVRVLGDVPIVMGEHQMSLTKLMKRVMVEGAGYDRFPLSALVTFARQFDDFKKFSRWYSIELNHGYYWHLTHDKNFKVSNATGPRDMSSMATGKANTGTYGDLMVTGDLEYWDESYNKDVNWKRKVTRPYVALFDATAIHPDRLTQVSRGFGNELYIHKEDVKKLKLIGVYSIEYARRLNRKFQQMVPQSEKELYTLWASANGV